MGKTEVLLAPVIRNMKKIFFILFTQFVLAQTIPIDSISFESYYGKELKQVAFLKQQQKTQPFNFKTQLLIAELYKQINCEDSTYSTLYKVYENEKNNKTLNEEDYKQLLFDLHIVESSKHNYSKDRRYFLKQLKEVTENDKEDKWKAKINYEIFKDYFLDSTKYSLANSSILITRETNFYKNDLQFRSSVLVGLGYFQTRLKKYQIAENTLLEALSLAEENKDKLRQVYSLINLGLNENYRSNYKKALYYFKKAEHISNNKYRLKIDRLLAINRSNSYYGIKDTINLKHQDLRILKLDSVINDFRKNSNFYEIDVAYQTKEKDEKIEELSTFQKSYEKNKLIYSILLFLVFLLALYSFVRWKKADRKKQLLNRENKNLNIENEKTKTELETVKSLVTNDHIVLKNKSKVYLDSLIYVKSDGHYLNLFTDTKKEFVRGKISEIEKQLPPNFVKCHRSYIVNQNYIKQYSSIEVFMVNGTVIPISRNFKF